MPVALRLSGNTDLAAQYRGEGKRLLFILKNQMEAFEQINGRLNRTMPDGSLIIVQSLPGFDIVHIHSPFFGEEVVPEKIFCLYILCYRTDELQKVYSTAGDQIREISRTPNLKYAGTDTGTAMALFSNGLRLTGSGPLPPIPEYLRVSGLAYDEWLKNIPAFGSYLSAYSLNYDNRYAYVDPGTSTPKQIVYRMAPGFASATNYYGADFYFPKKDDEGEDDSPVHWIIGHHSDFGVAADIKGKNNYTLDATGKYVTSWGERVHDDGEGSYSYLYQDAGVTVTTNPFTNAADIFTYASYVDQYLWPIVSTLNSRRAPRIYTFQYTDKDGAQEDSLFQDSLTFSTTGHSYNPGVHPQTDFHKTTDQVTYWPLAAIGGKKALYLKNTLSQQTDETSDTTQYPVAIGYIPEDGSYDLTETEGLTQEFYAGDTLIETLASEVSNIYDASWTAVFDDLGYGNRLLYGKLTNDRTDTGDFTATLRWAELIDYFNFKDGLLCFYKKIEEAITLDYDKTSHWEVNSVPGSYSETGTQSQTLSVDSQRNVEYWVYWKFGAASGKTKLAEFNCGLEIDWSLPATWNQATHAFVNGTATSSETVTASGDRIYGVSAHIMENLAAFSYNLETYKGITGYEEGYKKAFANIGYGYRNFYAWAPTFTCSLGVNRLLINYPFPAEDMNVYPDTDDSCWDGNFCVGAMKVSGENAGDYILGEFENQTDTIAATGIIALV